MTTPNHTKEIEEKLQEFERKFVSSHKFPTWLQKGTPNNVYNFIFRALKDAEERARTEGFIEGADATAIQQREIILSHLYEIENEAQGETAYDAIQRVRAFIQSLTPKQD